MSKIKRIELNRKEVTG